MAKMSKKKKVLIIVLAIVAVIAVGIAVMVHNVSQAVNQYMSGVISTSALERTDLTNTISVTGNIKSADVTKVLMEATGAGKATQVNVKVGDTVTAGDVLCTFDTEDLETAYEKTRLQTEQSAKLSEISLENSENTYANTKITTDQAIRNAETALENANKALDDAQEKYIDALSDYNAGALESQVKADPAYMLAYSEYSDAKALSNQAYYQWQSLESAANNGELTADERVAAQKKADSAKATYTQLQAACDQAYAKWQNISDEIDSGETYVTNPIDDYKDAVDTAQENVEKAEKSLTDAKKAKELSLSSSSAGVTSAKINADQTVAQMNLEDARKNIDKCSVTAPVSGTVTAVYATEGQSSNVGTLLFVIEDLSQLEIDTTVKEYDIASLETGMKAEIKTDATDDAVYQGTVSEIGITAVKNQAGDTMTSTNAEFDVKLAVDPGQGGLKVGMNARATIITNETKDVLAVTYSAVGYDEDNKPYVMVGRPGEKSTLLPEKVYIETGVETDYEVEVRGDALAEGDLIFDNPESVTEGVAVADMSALPAVQG